jgi:hypothetical protein
MTTDIELLSPRQLQKEAARVLSAGDGFGNHDLVKFNKSAHHDSHAWYRAVIQWYVDQYGDLPSRVGPGISVSLIFENDDAPSDV